MAVDGRGAGRRGRGGGPGLQRVCVFCGSSDGARPGYRAAAERLGEALAGRGIGLVYGGAHVGLMGRLADACRAAGGAVTGVIPRSLVEAEVAHTGLDDLRVVGTMHERKALMAELADGFVALPGGFGTLEEFCEVVTWSQLGLHTVPKPCGLLDVEGYFDPLVALFDRGVSEGFVRPAHRRLVLTAGDPDRLLDDLATWVPPPVTGRWA
ncbi:MAG TPA: TIGR00730 family Rossman fold protein [Acidimicrobiales bacterium]|nr:TIGR00730 family Rossman fold protein [Acidimicrobiales bacterium]